MQTLNLYKDASAYLEAVGPYLEAGGSQSNLILGLALQMRSKPERIQHPPYLAAVEDDAGVALAVMMTPPQRLLLYSAADDAPERVQPALDLLLQDLCGEAWDVPGVRGQRDMASYFASAWTAAAGGSSRLYRQERLYELDAVIPPPKTPGNMRLAEPQDLDCVARWTAAFHEYIGEPQEHAEEAQRMARHKIQDRAVYLWEDAGRPVSMSWKNRPTPRIVWVSGVYTPPEARRKGYASALVARQSQHLLNSGWERCCLYTDLSNPTSNSIYQKIGYRPVCDSDQIVFEQTV